MSDLRGIVFAGRLSPLAAERTSHLERLYEQR